MMSLQLQNSDIFLAGFAAAYLDGCGGGTARTLAPSSSPFASVAIANPHEFVRLGLRALLEGANCDVAACVEDAFHLTGMTLPSSSIVILDLWPKAPGGHVIWQKLIAPGCKLLVYTDGPLNLLRRRTLDSSGASACVVKSEPVELLLEALKAVSAGRTYFSRGADEHAALTLKLTPRELQVARLLASGKLNKEVAAALNLSIRTVETHRINLRRKLRLDNISEMTRRLIDEGLA